MTMNHALQGAPKEGGAPFQASHKLCVGWQPNPANHRAIRRRTMALPVFNVTDLNGRFIGHRAAWREIIDLCEKQGDAYALAAANDPKLVHNGEFFVHNEDSPDTYRATLRRNIDIGLEVYNRQMLVVVSSLFEVMFRHFWACAFFAKPDRLHEPLRQNRNTAKVELRDLLSFQSKESLLFQLAIDTARRAAEGKKEAAIRRIQSTFDKKRAHLTDSLAAEILKVIDERNDVVHRGKATPPTNIEVEAAFDVLHRTLGALQELARSIDLPMNEDGYCMLALDEWFYMDYDRDPPGC